MERSATKRLFIQLSVVGAGMCPMFSFGLGLSEIQIDSRLNQPLRARIEIIDVSDAEWRQIRTRLNWESAQDLPAAHPDILDSITLRAIEDASHRHFIEVRTARSVAEPLFDLPVEVAGGAARVIRNYSVLLDPPAPGEDLPRTVDRSQTPEWREASAAGSPPAAAPARKANPQANIARNPTATSGQPHRQKTHRAPSAAPGAPSTSSTSASDTPPEQKELQQQLEALQQTLAKMQETIAAQNAQIADLTAKVLARVESQAPRSPAAPAATARSPDSEANTANEAEPEANPRSYFWIEVGLGITTMVALGFAILARWRAAQGAPQPPTTQRMPEHRSAEDRQMRQVPTSSKTPAAQQKQMELEGTVEIDWHHEGSSHHPEWEKLLNEQHPKPQQHAPADTDPLPATYMEDLSKSYFSGLPTVATTKQSVVDTEVLPQAHAGTDAHTSILSGSDTAILPESDTARMPQPDTDALRQPDTVRLPQPDTASTRVLETDTQKLRDAVRLLEQHLSDLAEAETAKLREPESTKLTEVDAASLLEAGAPKPSSADPAKADADPAKVLQWRTRGR
jgi:hypothetical protein